MNELAVIVPTRGRAHVLEALHTAFADTTPVPHRLVFITDPDDPDSQSIGSELGWAIPLATRQTYPVKVNAGVRMTHERLVLIGADDIKPRSGWLEAASAYMNSSIGFVSLNDLGNPDVMAGVYATLPLIARWYADLDDELYYERYEHCGCDVDASYMAKARGAFAYAPEAAMEHLHPAWGKAQLDDTYLDGGCNPRVIEHDDKLLEQRWPEQARERIAA
jgi:hypothetical protein